jgi:hypothetical protein
LKTPDIFPDLIEKPFADHTPADGFLLKGRNEKAVCKTPVNEFD